MRTKRQKLRPMFVAEARRVHSLKIPQGKGVVKDITRTLHCSNEFDSGEQKFITFKRRQGVWVVSQTNIPWVAIVPADRIKHELALRGYTWSWEAGETPSPRGSDTALQIESHDQLSRPPGGATNVTGSSAAHSSLQTVGSTTRVIP